MTRTLGSLAGLAVGDLLGGLCGRENRLGVPAAARDALAEFSEGGPVPSAMRGSVSDDTILALAMMQSVAAIGFVSRTDLEARLRRLDTRGGRQIHALRASPSSPYIATTGATNGAVLRAVAIAYLHGANALGDLMYDALKAGSVTHGDPNALAASMVVGVTVAWAVDGLPPSDIKRRVIELSVAIRRICGGGDVVIDNLTHGFEALRERDLATGIDALEERIGFSVSAASSVVSGLVVGLIHTDMRRALPCLLLRRRQGWDLDSTAAVYGAVAGALEPGTIPSDLLSHVEADAACDFRRLVHQVLRQRAAIGRRLASRG